MTIYKWLITTGCALAVTLITGCGGGGSGTVAIDNPPPPPPPVGGIGRNGVAIGPIANFGSIIVNGVTYNTDNATFTIDDAAGKQSDLRVGQVVSVSGTIDDNGTSGIADQVTFDDSVKGPVESIDLAGSQLVVLGQTVLVRPETSFDNSFSPPSLAGISIGQIVEVSGQIDANGSIVATRLEPKPPATQFEVHGTVSNLDSANLRFNLNNLVVDYSSATLDDFSGGQISNGDFVEAKGSTLGATGELLATKVELESQLPGTANGLYVEIEGFITRFVSAQDFDVAGLPVTTTSSTAFEGGVAADLGLNVKIEVDGTIDANGVLVATEIDIRRAKVVRMTANADSVDAIGNTLVVLGITVTVDALTRLEDKSSADIDPLRIGDLNAGDYLEIRGGEVPAGSGAVLATILEREDPDTRTELQGFVTTVTEPSFVILGVTIETNGGTVFRAANGSAISASDFFNQVAPNSLVKARGSEVTTTTIAATEVEFETEF
jgi:hypothetical protein